MTKEKQYCVVAANKKTKVRTMIAGPYNSITVAESQLQFVNLKEYKYPKVAKYPYYKRNHGSKTRLTN